MAPLSLWLFIVSFLAALGQPGLVVVFYNVVLSRMHESRLKKVLALSTLPSGWLAATGVLFGALTGRAESWFLYGGNGFGDALLSVYLISSAVGGAAVILFLLTNPRRTQRPREELATHAATVAIPRVTPWTYGPLKRAFLFFFSPINQLTRIEVVTKEVELLHLPVAFDGLRLVHLTDFHIDHALEGQYFRSAVRLANRQAPDVVVLTGDYVSRTPQIPRIGSLLGGLQAPLGVFFIRGNHDFWTRPGRVRRQLESLGYTCLDNRPVILRRGEEAVALLGVEHPYGEKIRRWDRIFGPDLPACRIVLSHTPDIAPRLARAGCDLVLAGHTHGGQVQFPFVGVTLVPSKYGRRYAAGWQRIGQTLLYTSRGVGAFFPIRILCPPEITVFVLRARPPAHAEPQSGRETLGCGVPPQPRITPHTD